MAQIISQQIFESRNYQITSYFVPTVIMASTLFWVYFEIN